MIARIRAYRSSASVFGEAEAYLRDGNMQVITFPTLAEAEAEAERLGNLMGPNVRYLPVWEDE